MKNRLEKRSWVYLLTIEGKGYVGVTTCPHKRYETHMWELKKNLHKNTRMQEAFNRSGECSVEVLEEIPSWSAFDEELYWIYKLETYLSSKGYNNNDPRIMSYRTHEYTESHKQYMSGERKFIFFHGERMIFNPEVICLPDKQI